MSDIPPKSLWIGEDGCIIAITGKRVITHSWIERNAVSRAIRDQGKCSACWAFNAAEASQAAMKLVNKHVPTLSPQDIMNHTGQKGCRGAHVATALQWIKKTGVCSEGDCPYKGIKSPQPPSLSKLRYFIDDWTVIEDDESKMEEALKEQPLVVTIPGAPCVQHYKKGLMDLCRADDLFEVQRATNKNLVAEAHSVLLVERGHIIPDVWPDFEIDFWVIKNQWRDEWGNKGFGDVICNSSLIKLKKLLNMDAKDSDWFYGPIVPLVKKSKDTEIPYVDKVLIHLSPMDLKDKVEENPEITLIILLFRGKRTENPELTEAFRLISAYFKYDPDLTFASIEMAKYPTAGDILEVRISRKPVLLIFRPKKVVEVVEEDGKEDSKKRNLGDGKKFPEKDDLNFDTMLRWVEKVTGSKLKKDFLLT